MVNTNGLLKAIKEKGLKREQVAVALNVSLHTLNNKLSGKSDITVQELKSLSTVLAKPVPELLNFFD